MQPVLAAEELLAIAAPRASRAGAQDARPYAVALARITRPTDAEATAFVKKYVTWGAGPRASQYLVLGAKARAALDGRPMADYDDLRGVASSVLTHRLVINFAAEAAGRSAADIVEDLLKEGRWLAK